ncbi:DNA-binding CsgD family transcriptional regulator/tetratricopeptide (TPR) repeat protein [Crossiella equi]|uniref:DNA-binding CsgD family transcriptional regulator/tetratricopeptide (TPR) repeat protein n=1 Tax=Crossiella equi TaxID=130796 RepID=A0ABS5ALV4_9PSEU|nr:LuxR family transcriptional regulator [Crossiella equi]MBP2477543.1 DNA-binding CsgD family transcriptional regulator/tetratricopeptide (TPR) repeat protein [Crossiella equi]
MGREAELHLLRQAVAGLGEGTGAVVWVEGEAGIGKSSLVAKAVADAHEAGYDVLTGAADPMSQRSPLHVLLDLLQVWPRSPDPRRAEIAVALRDRRLGLLEPADVAWAEIELLVGLVDELCTARPTVLVLDDLQYLDEASFLLWHRLVTAVNQLPLLLLTTCRPLPRRREVAELRAALVRRGHPVLELEPLAEAESGALLTRLVGELPGHAADRLRALAMGNPLYLRELADAVRRDGTADGARLPTSFADALTGRLRVVPESAVEILRMAALLGGRFSVTELAVLMHRPAAELVFGLQDALAAGIVVDTGSQMAFRHPLIRQALYDAMPAALRAALHREAAQALASSGVGALRVAEQLLASGLPGDAWARGWLAETATALAAHAPELAIDLLLRDVDADRLDDEHSEILLVVLAWVLLGIGRYDEAAHRARQALGLAGNAAHRAEMYFVLVRALFSLGRNQEAVEAVRRGLSRTDLPVAWRARLLAALAMYQRASEGDVESAEVTARQALHLAESVGDSFGTAYALTVVWTNQSVRRDHAGALVSADRALHVLRAGPDHADLRALAEDGRIFTLQNLARWPEAAAALREEREGGTHQLGVTAAVLLYWLGEWEDALAELDPDFLETAGFTYSGLREPGPALLWHGVAALVTARQDERALAREHLAAGLRLPIRTVSDRENQDFLVAARAVVLEQDGDAHGAMRALAEVALDRRPGEMSLTHQWLPQLCRLATELGEPELARTALAGCRAEAAAESVPGRAAAAALRCAGLVESAPEPLLAAVEHYRECGPAVELAETLEDLAAVLAGAGETARARDCLHEATTRYAAFGAEWDIRRADRRLRELGVRRGVRGPRAGKDVTGWDALTPTELRVAELVADGQSTPGIAAGLFLSPRTVQTHISHILGKLGAKGRVEIAREVFRRRAEAGTPRGG